MPLIVTFQDFIKFSTKSLSFTGDFEGQDSRLSPEKVLILSVLQEERDPLLATSILEMTHID